MDMAGRGRGEEVSRSVPTSETSSSELDRSPGVLRAMFNGDKTYDNQLGNYNSAEELLIGLEPQGHRYTVAIGRGPECIVTGRLSAWRWKEEGLKGTGAHTNGVERE